MLCENLSVAEEVIVHFFLLVNAVDFKELLDISDQNGISLQFFLEYGFSFFLLLILSWSWGWGWGLCWLFLSLGKLNTLLGRWWQGWSFAFIIIFSGLRDKVWGREDHLLRSIAIVGLHFHGGLGDWERLLCVQLFKKLAWLNLWSFGIFELIVEQGLLRQSRVMADWWDRGQTLIVPILMVKNQAYIHWFLSLPAMEYWLRLSYDRRHVSENPDTRRDRRPHNPS